MVEELVRNGVTTFYAAPGSRSTPLVMAAASHAHTTVHMHFDERGTAFQTLGYGKATGHAAAWITTSGTALANGFPAVIEASVEEVPMILLTADRPPELRDTDANQTIRQAGIFGDYVEWFVDLAAPSSDIPTEYVLTTIDEAVARSRRGVVHLNCMFREPLAPTPRPYEDNPSDRLQEWDESGAPFTTYDHAESVSQEITTRLLDELAGAKRPMILLGRLNGDPDAIQEAVIRCCRPFGAVFIADISSQARLGLDSKIGIAHAEAVFYGNPPPLLSPDLVIQFGASPVSKRTLALAAQARHFVIDSRRRRIDPTHSLDHRIEADPLEALFLLAERAESKDGTSREEVESEWLTNWKRVISASEEWLRQDLGQKLTEQTTARTLSECLNSDVVLAVASSNPIRHMDLCSSPGGARTALVANRGTSGIDGTLATAMGFSDGHQKRPVVLIGDLALLHDMNSLALCASRNALLVVINNDGGGIFSYLPVRDQGAEFETLFGTPHGLGFESAAAQFGLAHSLVSTIDDLRSELRAALDSKDPLVIEVRTQRDANLEEQRRILAAMAARIAQLFGN